jgi:hypothetical protein
VSEFPRTRPKLKANDPTGGGLIGANGTDNGTVVPTNSDGTPNFTAINVTGGAPVPVDVTGAIDVWNLPQWVYDYEKQVAKPIYWAPNPRGGKIDIAPQFNNSKFLKANETGAIDPDTGNPVVGEIAKPNSFDTTMSAEQLMKFFASMDPGQLQPLQQMLANGPWGVSTTYVPSGVFDANTENALAQAVVQYLKVSRGAGRPEPFTTFLQSAEANTQQGQAAKAAGSAPTISLTDPAQIQQAAQSAAVAALGHALNKGQLNQFVSQFQSAQTNYQQTPSGGTGTPPDLSAESQAFTQQGDNSQEFSNHQAQGYMDAFMNMFLPAGSQRGNVQPVTPVGAGG